MAERGGILRRLAQAFLLQAVGISFAALFGVWVAGQVFEAVFMKRAIQEEAQYLAGRLDADPEAALPDTLNLHTYVSDRQDRADVPDWVAALGPGFHPNPAPMVSQAYVLDREDRRIYLVFGGERVSALATWFGILPLAAALVAVYLTTWFAYRASRGAVSPVVWLSREVRAMGPDRVDHDRVAPENLPAGADVEVVALADAIHQFALDLDAFVDRERAFTREASHELRTPITVIRASVEALAGSELSASQLRKVDRIARAVHDMEELTEVFLLLAREGEQGPDRRPVDLEALARTELDRAREFAEDKDLDLSIEVAGRPGTIEAPPRVLSVLVGNLVRNAVKYTERGSVRVRVDGTRVDVIDTGPGIAQGGSEPTFREHNVDSGFGVGLSIVRRLCERFGWRLEFSRPREHQGTCASLTFAPGGAPA